MEDEVGRACSTHGEEEKYIRDFDGKARWKETSLDVGGRILKLVLEI
jgi:hypothetical protein